MTEPNTAVGCKIGGMYYKFVCFPSGKGYIELCDSVFHDLGYVGRFNNVEEMLTTVKYLATTTTNYNIYINFTRRSAENEQI